jgi:hypothetical protein
MKLKIWLAAKDSVRMPAFLLDLDRPELSWVDLESTEIRTEFIPGDED